MNSDRRILFFAAIILFFQLIWLAAELEFIQIPWFSNSRQKSESPVVGKITAVYKNARQRASSEIIWHDGQNNEDIRAYDALLTLQDSAMKIKLNNGSELSLSENTLVFIEPLEGKNHDERIRIRFAHGSMRSHQGKSDKDFTTQSWEITADATADIQIKALESGKVEVEVIKGSASAGKGENQINLSSGEIVELGQNQADPKKQVSQNMSWQTQKDHLRVYSHQMPASIQLKWQGRVDKIKIYQDTKLIQEVSTQPDQQSTSVTLDEGIYEARLTSENQVSSWLRMDVWRAPVIHLMSPLPRDRYGINESLNYIWLKPQDIKTSHWQLSSDNTFAIINHKMETDSADYKFTASETGPYHWRVIGYDVDGFEIPAPYSNPIYFVPNPLSAPRLNKPELRKPAEKTDGATLLQKNWLKKLNLLQLFEEKSWAQDQDTASSTDKNKFNSKIHSLRLSWDKVKEAQHYILEISEKPDFRTLVVEEKVQGTSYLWQHINIKSNTFYWRVASGAAQTMGRFSSVAEINLQDLTFEKDNNGVRIESALKQKSEPVAPVIQPAEIKPQSQEIMTPEQIVEPNTVEQKTIYFEKPESVLNFELGYENSSWQGSSGTTFHLSGFVENISYRSDYLYNEKWRLSTLSTLQVTSWKNIDENSISKGTKTTELRGNFIKSLGHSNSLWSFAVGLSFLNLPSRADLEIAKLSFEILPSIGAFYDIYDNDSWRGKTGFLLMANSDLYQASILLTAQKTLYKYENSEAVLGAQTEITESATTSGSTNGLTYIIGATLGWRW